MYIIVCTGRVDEQGKPAFSRGEILSWRSFNDKAAIK